MAEDAAAATPATTRPQKPDQAEYEKNLAKADRELQDAQKALEAVRRKMDLATGGRNSDNPANKRRQELIAQLDEIKKQQGADKATRGEQQNNLKRLEDQLKDKKKEIKDLQELVGVRSEEELDRNIAALEQEIAKGTLPLLQEKKNVEQIGKYKRSRKQFAIISEKQKAADDLQSKIQEIKGSRKDPEAQALREKYTAIQTELDALRAEQDAAHKEFRGNRDEKKKLQDIQNEKWDAKKRLEREYREANKAFKNYEREQKQKAWERQRAERERIDKERKKERAQKMLAEASDPAYLDEIRRANSLLQYFDPTFVPEKAPLQASSGLEAQAERKVDDAGIKGVKIVSKKDLDDDYLPAVKKGKKGKKTKAAGAKSTYSCPPSVVEDCSFMGIDPPMSAEEVPAVVEKVKAKLDHWKSDQTAQTKRNIEKAQKEIEKIEAEEAKEKEAKKSSSGTATPAANGDATPAKENGEEKADKAVEELASDIAEKATLEQSKEEVAAA